MKKLLLVLIFAACAAALISGGLSMAGLDYNHLFAYSAANNSILVMLLGALVYYQESEEKKWLYAAAFWGMFLILGLLLAGVVQRFRT